MGDSLSRLVAPLLLLLTLSCGWPLRLAAQEPATKPAAPSPALEERKSLFPNVDVYLPEGDLNFKLNRLVNKAFFEGQFKYNFVNGDLTAFLRYRYYGFLRTYQITFFDAVEFADIEKFSGDFQRVRGALLLVEWPHDYHHRTFLLSELDGITSNKQELRFDNGQTNTFVRLGYQIGTPDDSRSNAVVGERRAEVEHLFSPYRQIGPGDAGLTTALTYGFDFVGGDFDYAKVELEGLKRFELPHGLFLFGRLRGGTFLAKKRRELPGEMGLLPLDLYAVPRNEFFSLDGRSALKGLASKRSGSELLLTTWELFTPWFTEESRRLLGLDWHTWYWVLYTGAGTTGLNRDVYSDLSGYVPDVGIGFESSLSLRKYAFFLSGVIARAFEKEGGFEARISIKSYH